MLTKTCIWAFAAHLISAAAVFGRLENVPQEARDAALSGLVSPIVNGLNFQSRIDVKLVELSKIQQKSEKVLPVDREYRFEAFNLDAGEYELTINAYDFTVQNPRYRILVGDESVEAYEDPLASISYNETSKQILTRETPLLVQISGFKDYYETPQGKLVDMLMSSPLGVIFRSKFYSTLFFGTLAIIIFPYVIPYLAPEFAEQYKQMQAEMNAEQNPAAAAIKEEEEKEVISPEKAAVRASRAKHRR